MTSLAMLNQILIALTGVVAIWLTQQSNDTLKKYACLFGLAGQPFWFYSAYSSEQWGIFALCFVYTYSWCIGIKNNWLNQDRQQVQPMGRSMAIQHIENLYPCDSEFEDTADIGQELLEQAIAETGWRNMPDDVLVRLAQLCIHKHNWGARIVRTTGIGRGCD